MRLTSRTIGGSFVPLASETGSTRSYSSSFEDSTSPAGLALSRISYGVEPATGYMRPDLLETRLRHDNGNDSLPRSKRHVLKNGVVQRIGEGKPEEIALKTEWQHSMF